MLRTSSRSLRQHSRLPLALVTVGLSVTVACATNQATQVGAPKVQTSQPTSPTSHTQAPATSQTPIVPTTFSMAECNGVTGGAESAALFDKACDGGDAAGCAEATGRYLCGAGVARDLHKAGDRAMRACERGRLGSCATAGILVSMGDATPAEIQRALRKGCDGGDVGSCNNLALAMMGGTGVPADPSQAAVLFEKLCKQSNWNSCGNAGMMYLVGVGVAKDVERGVALAKRGCDQDDPQSCNILGVAYAEGDGAGGAALAMPLFEKACRGGQTGACDNLGQFYVSGTTVEKDLAKAEALFRAACSAGNATACTHLAKLVAEREAAPTTNTDPKPATHSF